MFYLNHKLFWVFWKHLLDKSEPCWMKCFLDLISYGVSARYLSSLEGKDHTEPPWPLSGLPLSAMHRCQALMVQHGAPPEGARPPSGLPINAHASVPGPHGAARGPARRSLASLGPALKCPCMRARTSRCSTGPRRKEPGLPRACP